MKRNTPTATAEAQIEQWPLNRLIPYARNPRKNDHAVGQMVSAIKEFGFKIPILARSDGEVVDGHLRLKAAQHLQLERVPVILCDEWSEAKVKAFRLLANRSVTWAEWDEELLSTEFEELKNLDVDLSMTGFGTDEIEKFLSGSQVDAPSGFSEYDESIETEHQCPKCGYQWSGKTSVHTEE
jgi:ParB-like chromosome segregation protein Spo0J